MTTLDKVKKLLELREAASQGEWRLGHYEAPCGIESSIDTKDWVVVPCDDYKKPTRPDADLITYAANNITEICRAFVGMEQKLAAQEGVIMKFITKSNGLSFYSREMAERAFLRLSKNDLLEKLDDLYELQCEAEQLTKAAK